MKFFPGFPFVLVHAAGEFYCTCDRYHAIFCEPVNFAGMWYDDVMRPIETDAPRDWAPLINHYLHRFRDEGIAPADVDALESWANNATAFDATGSWRARIINGTLWVKPLRFHEHWAERANVLRMILVALRAGPPPPDLDFVYGHVRLPEGAPVALAHYPCTSLAISGRRGHHAAEESTTLPRGWYAAPQEDGRFGRPSSVRCAATLHQLTRS